MLDLEVIAGPVCTPFDGHESIFESGQWVRGFAERQTGGEVQERPLALDGGVELIMERVVDDSHDRFLVNGQSQGRADLREAVDEVYCSDS